MTHDVTLCKLVTIALLFAVYHTHTFGSCMQLVAHDKAVSCVMGPHSNWPLYAEFSGGGGGGGGGGEWTGDVPHVDPA